MSRKEDRRIDHKRLRSAERQALAGGHTTGIESYTWGHRPEQPPLVDDRMPAKGRKGGKGCKRNKGAPHIPEYRYETNWRRCGWHCARCGKRLWGYKPPERPTPVPTSDHWGYGNITRRLAGLPCRCESCNDATV